MQFANNDSGQKISPGFSGQRGWCSLCKNEMVACCGDINIDYWRHLSKTNCDSWKEAETAWHRNWKEQFPAEWREKVIQREGQFHRADIQTADGVVIEFQNSFISASNIRTREDFYGNMIWVINAKEFDQNIRKRSIVRRKLKEIDENQKSSLFFQRSEITDTEKTFDEKIKSLSFEIEQQINQQNQYTDKIQLWIELSKQLPIYLNKLFTGWLEKEYDYDDYRYRSLHDAIGKTKERVRAIRKEKILLLSGRQQPVARLDQINGFTDINLEGRKLKLVPYDQLPKSQFANIYPVLLSSLNGFFPSYLNLNSENELLSMIYKQKEYGFAFDVSYAVAKYESEREAYNSQIETLDNEVASILLSTVPVAKNWLEIEIKKLEKLVSEAKSVQHQQEIALNTSKERKQELLASLQKDLETTIRKSAKITDTQRFSAMREFKGQYHIHWKHERKTWQYAKATLFFDTNDGFLWERLEDSSAQKIKVEDFIATHLPYTSSKG